VAIEATCNPPAIARLMEPRVAKVVVSNPQKTRAIAEAKLKTDKVDAEALAQLLAADYLPAAWLPDDDTHALRRQVARRAHIVRQRTRLKNQVQSILHRNLLPRCPAADLFGRKGRAWLAEQELPADERRAVEALLRQLAFHAEELRLIDAELGRVALGSEEVKRLMTIPGVDATVALSIVAAVGDFARFRSPQRLVSYLGLNPRVPQSGGQPASMTPQSPSSIRRIATSTYHGSGGSARGHERQRRTDPSERARADEEPPAAPRGVQRGDHGDRLLRRSPRVAPVAAP
jgi:transposase